MKQILLLSDTHGYIDDRILNYAKQVNEIWHAGDWGPISVLQKLEALNIPIKAVYGNIDSTEIRNIFPKNLQFETESVKVMIQHIGGYPDHYAKDVKKELLANNIQLFISGHSHILKIIPDKSIKNLLHFNPGAAGNHGFHKVRTMIRFKIDCGKIFDVEVIELGLRNVI